MAQARGLRNNNPLNIRRSNNAWQGKIAHDVSTDKSFEQFQNIFYGIRAAFVCLRSHLQADRKKLKRTTVTDEINKWAPATENDTERYISFVCAHGVLSATEVLDYKNKNQVCRLLWAMAHFECGEQLPFNYFERAYEMAAN